MSLAISIDTVEAKQIEIKCLYEHINVMKKKGNQSSSIGTTEGGCLTENAFPQYAVVGCTAPHKKDSCYFDPKKMTDRREWDQKFMDDKGVTCNDNE